MKRREYPLNIEVNGRKIKKAVIDPHYEIKHSDSITDEIILDLVALLDGGTFPVQTRDDIFEYFVTDNLRLEGKRYKLVWLLEKNEIYIGIVNAYRRQS
ncbi:MAG: hypothetical protein H6626_09085 [Pseudobdellovibrionaceae bacterium]|nr:hypothetical protein [Bdellovibrionales bacterium]USN46369.1 MAG: hypothetical protein H6626_09085 [Pseudobdellovibrionaceae bacterium]